MLVDELVVSNKDLARLVGCQELLGVFVQKLNESLQVVVLLRTVLIYSDAKVGFINHVHMDKGALKLDSVHVCGSLNNISAFIDRRIGFL